ncbi:hypothetical protein AB6859_07700 [Rahnella inusitata]|uniref:hypothetical protein n=1 Tax=Rahnella inusitata TaxID=58169 RepID=UPI0039BE1C84
MENGKLVSGGIVVGALILLKLAAKTAFIGAIFGGFFGGASYVKTEYEMSVDHMKTEAEYTNKQKSGTEMHEGYRFDHAYVDEDTKRLIYDYTWVQVSKQDLDSVVPSELIKGIQEDKEYSIRYLKSEAMFKTLFEHGWSVEYRSKTNDGILAEDYVITRQDIL